MAELKAYLPWAHNDYDIAESTAWIEQISTWWRENDARHEFFVVDATGTVLGNCGLTTPEGEAGIGYWIRTSATRRGVATRLVNLLTLWGFDELGLTTIKIEANPKNLASRRVAEKAGFAFVGEDEHTHDDGRVHRQAVYRLSR